MDRLWAPWRIKYIQKERNRGCIFCKIFSQKKRDKKNFVVFRLKHCFAVLNIFPYNNGHMLVVPNRHVKDLRKKKKKEFIDLNRGLVKCENLLREALKPEGFNVGINIGKAAGAGIKQHLHFHIVPRWSGDTNFISIVSETKIISQSLDDLYSLLKKN